MVVGSSRVYRLRVERGLGIGLHENNCREAWLGVARPTRYIFQERALWDRRGTHAVARGLQSRDSLQVQVSLLEYLSESKPKSKPN